MGPQQQMCTVTIFFILKRFAPQDQEAKDTSNRSRDASARVALRYLLAKKPPHLIRMWNTEAEQVVEVSPETAEKDKSKYKKPSKEQLESFERERGTGGVVETLR